MSPDLRGLLLGVVLDLEGDVTAGAGGFNIIMCEYTKWLNVIRDNPTATPPEVIKDTWYRHIINSRNYMAVCDIIKGEYIHCNRRAQTSQDIIPLIRQIEPFTSHTATVWGCKPQSPAYNLPPEGEICVHTADGPVALAYHPRHTREDLLIKLRVPDTSLLVWKRQVIKKEHSLESQGVCAGDVLVLIIGYEN
jgi:hypothetical protein